MKVLDLFSGIGGFSLGLERAGMQTVAFCEQDKHCQKVLKKHWPDVPIYDDVKTLKGKDFKNIDLVCGGFPCQDISVAGNKEGLKGERSGLWREFKRIIKEVKPRYVIIENVANLRSLGLQTLLKDLWSLGYASEWHIISARSIGACHLRERIWIIAYSNGSTVQLQPRGSSRQDWKEDIQLGEVGADGDASNSVSQRTQGRSDRRSGQKAIRKKGQPSPTTLLPSKNPAYSDMPRLWRPFASEKEKSEWWTKVTTGFRHWWETQSEFCRMDDGLPRGLDKIRRERIKMLGNSVVPFIPELIGRLILDYENKE